VGNGGYLAGQNPSFWTSSYGADGDYRMAWTGFIRIDNVTYQFQGDAFGNTVREGLNAQQLSMTYTATRTIFTFEADSVLFNVTFMTPIWPHDYLRQSESCQSDRAGMETDLSTLKRPAAELFAL
jgi:hypothetical protein